jgi:RNA recognition motif-containing protein
MNIFIGNISRDSTDAEIKKAFEECGEVTSCKIILDKSTGVSKGFGFVEMPNKEEAENAIKKLNGFNMNGRVINVAVARPKTENKPSRGYNKYGNNTSMNKRRY